MKLSKLHIFALYFMFFVPGTSYADFDIKYFTASNFQGVNVPLAKPYVEDDNYITLNAERPTKYIYEDFDMKNISYLYWALNYKNPKFWGMEYIDSYLKLHECEVYKKYFSSETDWNKIREKTRDYIYRDRGLFPTRYSILQPIFFSNYDLKDNKLNILESYQYISLKRLEVHITNENDYLCNDVAKQEIPGIPRVLIVNFSRPFTIRNIPLSSEKNTNYLNLIEKFKKSYPREYDDAFSKNQHKKGFIFFKINIFSQRDYSFLENRMKALNVLAALEGFDIYADLDQKFLLYSRNFLDMSGRGLVSVDREKEFKALKVKYQGSGILIE